MVAFNSVKRTLVILLFLILVFNSFVGVTKAQENNPKLWDYKVEGQVKSVYINGDTVLVGSTDDKVHALRNGNQIWDYDIGRDVWKVRSKEDLVVASTFLNQIYALNSSGDFEWKFEQNGGIGDFASSEDKVLIASTITDSKEFGYFSEAIVLNMEGSGIGQRSIKGKVLGTEVSGSRGFVWTENNLLYSFSLLSGGSWSYESSAQINDIMVNDGRLLIGMDDGTVTAIGSSKLVLWKKNLEQPINKIHADGSRIAVGTEKGKIYLLESGGTLLWEKKSKSDFAIKNIFVSNERVVFGSTSGVVYVVDPNNGEILWKYDLGHDLESLYVGGGKIVAGGNEKIHVLDLEWYEKVSKESSDYREEGDMYFSQGNYSKAISEYSKALEILDRGDVFIGSKNDQGVSYIKERIDTSEEFSSKKEEAQNLLEEASDYYEQGEYEKAISNYERVIKIYENIDVSTVNVNNKLEEIRKEKEQWGEAQKHLQNATELFSEGQYNKSIKEYEEVIDVYEQLNVSTTSIENKKEKARKKIQFKDKERELEKAQSLEKEAKKALEEEMYTRAVNKFNQSLKFYEKYEKEEKSSQLKKKLENASEKKNKYFEGLQHISKGDEFMNDPEKLDFGKAEEEYTEAKKLYQEIGKNTSMIQKKIKLAQSKDRRGKIYMITLLVVFLAMLIYLNFFRG